MSQFKVLVADDDLSLRKLLVMALETSGYVTVEASNAESCLQVLSSENISVLVLDMGMPPHEHSLQEGVKVLDTVAQQFSLVKVIVLTGQEAEVASYTAIKHGAFDFLEKPVSAETLIAAIKRAELFIKQEQKLSTEGVEKFDVQIHMGEGMKKVRNAAEQKLLKKVLADTNFNVHETARRLGLKRENVYYLINKYGLERVVNE